MKKIQVLISIIVSIFIFNSCNDVQIKGESSKLNWEIVDGTLILSPENGKIAITDQCELIVKNQGHMEKYISSAPWGDTPYVNTIRSVKVKDGCKVIVNEKSQALFYGLNSVINLDLSGFDFSQAKDISYMFAECTSLNNVIINSDVSSVTDMSHLFDGDCCLKTIDLGFFNTENVKDFSYMFNNTGPEVVLSCNGFNTGSAENMSHLFSETNIGLSLIPDLKTENVTDMSYMFYSNIGMLNSTPDFSGFDTQNVLNMEYMFSNCMPKRINLSSFDTSNVTNMRGMFAYTSQRIQHIGNDNNIDFVSEDGLTEIDLSGFDTSIVTDMSEMFRNSTCLKKVNIEFFNTQKVQSFEKMFLNCSDLSIVEGLSKLDYSSCKNVYNMFGGCVLLSGVDSSYDYNELGVIE